jgi:ring-1,2-phenylacetyl-CoA epoxidase subunit PaaC
VTATQTRALADYVLALGDDALVMAQRLGWWISRAPELEEDMALANLGLDQLGQARMLLTYAGEAEEWAGEGPRTEDDLAYWRDAPDFRNVCLVERPMADFGLTTARLLLFAAYQRELYSALRSSADPTLAAIAGKAIKEVTYHLDHAEHWVRRLGDGTEESHRRMQQALDDEWRWAEELYDASWLDLALVESGIAVDPRGLREGAIDRVAATVREATLTLPSTGPTTPGAGPSPSVAGRHGRHTEHLAPLLAELQSVARAHPGAVW